MCFFIRGESYDHDQMAADMMNWASQTVFCMFKVNKSEFNVLMAITSHPVEAYKKEPKHTQKQKQDRSLGAFLTNNSKCSQDPEKPGVKCIECIGLS